MQVSLFKRPFITHSVQAEMWSRQCQLMKTPHQSISSVCPQVRCKHFRLCKVVGMELSCSKRSIQLHQEILVLFLGSSFVVHWRVYAVLETDCVEKSPFDRQSWPSTEWSSLDTCPYFILSYEWPWLLASNFPFWGFTYSYFLHGKKIFLLLSGFGDLVLVKRVFLFVFFFHNWVIPVLLERITVLVV